MDCTPFLVALNICTMEPAPAPLPYTAEKTAQAECLTKQQARAKYGTSHLYWHTANRCWDDQPGRTRRYAAPRALAKATDDKPMVPRNPLPNSEPSRESKPLNVSDASGNATDKRKARIEVYYPALMQAQAAIAADMYAVQRPITEWPLMMDIDALGPDPDKGIDGCCWPNMQILLLEQPK